jgi:hypothetical protein
VAADAKRAQIDDVDCDRTPQLSTLDDALAEDGLEHGREKRDDVDLHMDLFF